MQSKSSKKSLPGVKKHDIVDLLSLLDKCTQILKEDRVLLRKLLKEGDQNIENLLVQHKKKPEMGILQQDLRRIVKTVKRGGKQPEGAVLANIQNRAAVITEQRKPIVMPRGNEARREGLDFAGKARVTPINDFGIGRGLTSFEVASPKFNPFPHPVLTPLPSSKAFPVPGDPQSRPLKLAQMPDPLRFHDFPSSCKAEKRPAQVPAESPLLADDPLDFPSRVEGTIEQTQKSPLLGQNPAGFAGENEQNTIVNFSIFGGEKPGTMQEKPEGNFMSFKEFNERREEETLKKSDLLDRVKKLSFREEDYFEQSVRIEEQRNNEENCSFELLNAPPINPEFPDIQPIEDERTLKKEDLIEAKVEESPERKTDPQPENLAGPGTGKGQIDVIEPALIDSSLSLRFARPFDLPVGKRDQYVDSLFLRFRFAHGAKETARFKGDSPPDLSPQALGALARFDKKTVEFWRTKLGLDRVTPEELVSEVFHSKTLAKVSRSFFTIRVQEFIEKNALNQEKTRMQELLTSFFDLCDLKKDGFLDINELGLALDGLCLRKDYQNPAREVFDRLDPEFSKVLTRERLAATGKSSELIERVFQAGDREGKGFLTYWDLFRMRNSLDLELLLN